MTSIFDMAKVIPSFNDSLAKAVNLCDKEEYDWLCEMEDLNELMTSFAGEPGKSFLDILPNTSKSTGEKKRHSFPQQNEQPKSEQQPEVMTYGGFRLTWGLKIVRGKMILCFVHRVFHIKSNILKCHTLTSNDARKFYRIVF